MTDEQKVAEIEAIAKRRGKIGSIVEALETEKEMIEKRLRELYDEDEQLCRKLSK
jgi:cell division protein FtsB